MKKIFALLAATVVIASASNAQTGSDTTTHKKMTHKSTAHKTMHMKKDSTAKKPM